MRINISWSFLFYLLNRDCQQTAHTISIITLTICLHGIWMPLKHNPGIILPKRDELLGFTPIVLMVVFYMSTALLLYYGSLNRIAELYLPFIFVHTSKITYDCFEIVRSLSQSLHYLRLSLDEKSISELIYFPTKLEWNYRATAYEKFRVVGFVTAEIIIRAYVLCVVWKAWSLVQLANEKPSTDRTDVEIGTSREESTISESDQVEIMDSRTRFIEQRVVVVEKF